MGQVHFSSSDKIGQGGFGAVYKGMWFDREVAIKVFDVQNMSFDLDLTKREIALMSVLKHENLVPFFGAAFQERGVYIISQLVKGGSLETYWTVRYIDLKCLKNFIEINLIFRIRTTRFLTTWLLKSLQILRMDW